jgi:hypothetical protein
MRLWTPALVVGALVGLVGCDIEAPELPTYETRITIPLSEQRKTLASLVEDNAGILIVDDDIRIDISRTLDTMTLDDELSVTASGTSFSNEVGAFDLPSDLGGTVGFTIDDLVPGFPEGDLIVPPFPFSVPERELSGLDQFTTVEFATGDLVVDVTNDLAVPAGGACGAIAFTIRESSGGPVVATLVHSAEIAPGQTVQLTEVLGGASLTSTMTVEITGCSPGSGGSIVTVAGTDGLNLSLSLQNVSASSATAEIPGQAFSTTGSTTWGDDMLLESASVLSGGTSVSFVNTTPLGATVTMRFPAFEQGGSPFEVSLPLPASGSDTVALDFSGVMFSASPATNVLEYEVDVTVPGSGGNQVTLNATDAIDVTVGDVSLELAWLVGVPSAIEQSFGPFTDAVEWPEDTDGIAPAAATFSIVLTSEIGIDVAGSVTLDASNPEGETASLTQGVWIDAGALGSPVTTTVTFDGSNSDILDLLALFPDEITISGALDVGDGAATARLDRGASVDGMYNVSAPFAFIVTGGSIELDPVLLSLDEDTRERLLDNVSRVELVGDLSNGFPFGATATLMFAPDEASVYTAPELTLEPVSAPAAEVDPISGKAETAAESEQVIDLDASELEVFRNPDVYLGVRLDLEPSDGVVVMSASNEIVVTSHILVDLTVSNELFEGDE